MTEANQGQVNILLVDDRAENLLALEAILEPLGQCLVRAQSGEAALRSLLSQEFAVLLLDVQMPGMNGFETAQLIKSRERTRFVPIIFLTAISKEEEYVFKGYSVGAVDYLFKPFQPEILRSKVNVFVELCLQRRRIAEQEQRLHETERKDLELTHVRELLQAEARQAQSLAESAKKLRELNEELKRRQMDLERAMTARSRFYASMSHELRTPINAVLGYSTLLLERIYGPLNEKQVVGIERSQKAARHLLELVNDVLDLSKIEAGKIDLRLQPVEFPALIEDLFVTVRPLADQHGSTLTLDRGNNGTGPIKVVSDPRRVRQILLNLLSNAIKFGRSKPIRVVCHPLSDGGVMVEVIDQGDGISKEDQERIFHEFVQLGQTQLHDGTGLGLPISRRLAELLRGSLTVESTPGVGSTFRLCLPAGADVRTPPVTDLEVPRSTTDERPVLAGSTTSLHDSTQLEPSISPGP
ncbi:MAG: ATP-binding response regulator [Thermoanaerobaculia bacterium]